MYPGKWKGEIVIEKMYSVILEFLWTDKKYWEKFA